MLTKIDIYVSFALFYVIVHAAKLPCVTGLMINPIYKL